MVAGLLLPLTLTLSPQAGRGSLPHVALEIWQGGSAFSLLPVCGEMVAGRPDEGLYCASREKLP